MKYKGKRLWITGFLIICTAVNVGSSISNAAQSEESVQMQGTDILSVSGNEGDIYNAEEVISIQVPENLDFIIDPWNLSGLGQIYSQDFTIRNNSKVSCTLYLKDIVCCSEQENGAVIVEDTAEVYAQDIPNVYLEMVFQTGEKLILSPKESEYVINLEPGGELVFWFTGK